MLPDDGSDAPTRRLSVHGPRGWTLLDVAEIDWIEGAGVYARLVTATGVHLIRETLANLEARLDPAVLLRIHRSLLVNVDRVRHVHPCGKDFEIVLDDGSLLRGSRTYRDNVLRLVNLD